MLSLTVLLSAGLAFWITGLGHASAEPTLLYVFVCGVIAICAMILPGVSGAYLLLVLGLYPHLTGILERLRGGELTIADAATVFVFAAGCAVGITSFSKALRWLLAHRRNTTLAVLCGFMIGALQNIWPFQTDLTPQVLNLKHKHFEAVWPSLDVHVVFCLMIGITALATVMFAERLSRSH